LGVIDGTTLEIIKHGKKGKVYCKCHVCNMVDVYNKKYLVENSQECRYCKQVKNLYYDESLNETNQINILIKEEKLRNEGKLGKLRAGRKYVITSDKYKDEYGDIGENLEVIGVYGSWGTGKMMKPTHIITKCLVCGALKIRMIQKQSGVTVKYGCKTCTKIKEYRSIHENKLKDMEKREKLEREKEIERREEQKGKLKRNSEAKKLEKYTNLIKDNNREYFVSVDNTDDKKVAYFVCKSCGYITTKVRPNKNFKVQECPGCVQRLKNKNYRGICKLDMRGKIYNGMEIIDQYTDEDKGYLCDIKCAVCGEAKSTIRGVSLLDVINRKYVHDCDYYITEYKCDKCGNINSIKVSKFLENQTATCDKCGNELDKSVINYDISAYDMKLNFNRARKSADGKLIVKDIKASQNSNLYYESIPIYRSNDEDYFRCICSKHGTRLTLSSTEINNYDCERCNDVHENTFKTLNPKNIKVKGNMRIRNTDK